MREAFGLLVEHCHQLRAMGPLNRLLSDGEYVAIYCTNSLHWITRRAPFGKARLVDDDVVIDFQQETTPEDVSVIATQPLTGDECWHEMAPGDACLFYFGALVAT